MKNESATDRVIRGILGVSLLLIAYMWLSGTLMIIAYVLGVILLITSATGFCMLYKILGINTDHKKITPL